MLPWDGLIVAQGGRAIGINRAFLALREPSRYGTQSRMAKKALTQREWLSSLFYFDAY